MPHVSDAAHFFVYTSLDYKELDRMWACRILQIKGIIAFLSTRCKA